MTGTGWEFRGVTVVRSGETHLSVEELHIPGHGVTALVGPNGAGKTTLLRVMAAALRPTTGTVLWNGHSLSGDDDGFDMRRRIAYVPQKPYMFAGSVLANAVYGLRVRGVPTAEARARAMDALKRAGIDHLAYRQAVRLSGGEAQRVAMARALVTVPEALLLDEPTSSLDAAAQASIARTIRATADGGIPVIVVTHDRALVRDVADRVVRLEEGRASEIAEGVGAIDTTIEGRNESWIS